MTATPWGTCCRSGPSGTCRRSSRATSPTRARWCWAVSTTPGPRVCSGSSPTTSSSRTRCCTSTCRPGSSAAPCSARWSPPPCGRCTSCRARCRRRSRHRAPGSATPWRAGRPATATSWSATYDELVGFGLDDLAGKSVITSAISEERLAVLRDLDVDLVLDGVPQPFPVTVTAAVLEAMMQALVGSGRLTNDDMLDMIVGAGLEPRVLYPNGWRRKSRFAFVIHPLSQTFFTKVEPLGTITRWSPGVVNDALEKVRRVRPAVHLQPRDRHQVAVGGRGRGVAHHGRRDAQGADGAQPGVHLRPPAAGGGHGPQARRPGDGSRSLHQGRGRRGGHGGQEGLAPGHHRQQLQRLGGAVGGPRGAPQARHRGRRRGRGDPRPGDGDRRDRRDRVGLLAAARPRQRRALARLARDRQAARP